MRILALYYTHKRGGFCQRLYRLLNALAERGHAVRYLSLDPPPLELSKKVIWVRIPFFLKLRKGLLFWFFFSLILPWVVLLEAVKFKPERYLAFGAYYAFALSLARIAIRAPLCLFLRSLVLNIDQIEDSKPWIVKKVAAFVEKRGILSASKIVFLTNTMSVAIKSLIKDPLPPHAILPNEVKPQDAFIKSERQGKLILLYCGVLIRWKNVALLLAALIELPSELQENIELRILGDGPLSEELKQLAKTGNLGEQVKFLGWKDSVKEEMLNADLLLHPALQEGMPNVIMEALSLKLPVLASRTPEHQEILHFEELLFSPDSPAELAAKLTSAIREVSVLESWQKLSQERASFYTFDWEERASQEVITTER